jgi:HK97 family phage prohead protease
MLYQELAWTGGEGGFETKALKEGADVASFTGVASTSQRDRARDIIAPDAFGTISAKEVRMFRDHNREHLIGGWTKFEQQDKSLAVEGQISLLTEKGRETYALMKQGFLNGLSVGFLIEPGGASWDDTKQVRTIKKAELLECSVCALPANRGARVSTVKSLSRDDTWQWLRDNGLSDDDIDVVMKKGFDALLATSGRTNITEIDGYRAKGGDSLDDDRFTALAAEVQALLNDVKERRLS